MSEEITIACPKCDTHFLVPREFCGGIVDCTECGTTFEIQAPKGENMKNTDTGRIKHVAVEDGTSTVSMSRNDIGMIPELDNVKIG